MVCFVRDKGSGNRQDENQPDAKQKSSGAFPVHRFSFLPSVTLFQSFIPAFFAYSIEHRFPDVPGKAVMFQQMILYASEFFTVQVDQPAARFAFAVKMICAPLILHKSIAGTFSRAEYIFSDDPILGKPFELSIDRRCSDRFVRRLKVILYLRGGVMLPGFGFQILQQFFLGLCLIGFSGCHTNPSPRANLKTVLNYMRSGFSCQCRKTAQTVIIPVLSCSFA
jgi:hypothetical protein